MYPPVRRRNDSHGSGTDSQDNEGKHEYERDPRAWPNYPVPTHPGNTILTCLLLLIIIFYLPFGRQSRSYGSWIYNFLCNQCLSPLTL